MDNSMLNQRALHYTQHCAQQRMLVRTNDPYMGNTDITFNPCSVSFLIHLSYSQYGVVGISI